MLLEIWNFYYLRKCIQCLGNKIACTCDHTGSYHVSRVTSFRIINNRLSLETYERQFSTWKKKKKKKRGLSQEMSFIDISNSIAETNIPQEWKCLYTKHSGGYDVIRTVFFKARILEENNKRNSSNYLLGTISVSYHILSWQQPDT